MIFNYNERNIRYVDSGKGSTILLLHGYLESADIWNGFSEKLAVNFRVISVDLPGHGESDVYGVTHTMDFMAEAISGLLDFLNAGSTFVIGHSLGGYVALALAELFTEKLSGYCLFHSQPFPDAPAAFEKRKKEILLVSEGNKDLVYPENIQKMFADSNLEILSDELNRSKEIASKTPAEGMIAVLNGMMQRPSRRAFMESGKLPCLWILGALDNYIPLNVILEKVNLPGNAKVVVLNKSGHMGFIEEQEESVSQVTEFIIKNNSSGK